MSTTPDEIRDDIDRTQERISENIGALQEKVDPRRIAQRGGQAIADSVSGATDRLMGTARSAGDAAASSGGRVRSATTGNPWAMGLGAFAAGWLVASLIPASSREQQAVAALPESPALGEAVTQVAQTAQEAAGAAVADIRDTAKDAAGQVTQQVNEQVGGSSGTP